MRFAGTFRQPSFNELPTVVKNLLIINVLMFLTSLVLLNQFEIDLSDILGLHYPGSEKFQPYQIITYMFMHDMKDYFHIIFNMLALWMFGYTLENVWGSKRFLIYYLITGIGAGICHYTIIYFQIHDILQAINEYIANPSLVSFDAFSNANGLNLHASDFLGSYNPQEALQVSVDQMRQLKVAILNGPNIIGASGAIYGILLAFGVLFPNRELYLYFAIPVKAKWAVLIFGCIELGMGLYAAKGDNVGHFAHLGGMIFGFILIKYWQRNSKTFY
jgi:membrane associated rhomboid family serine protease